MYIHLLCPRVIAHFWLRVAKQIFIMLHAEKSCGFLNCEQLNPATIQSYSFFLQEVKQHFKHDTVFKERPSTVVMLILEFHYIQGYPQTSSVLMT